MITSKVKIIVPVLGMALLMFVAFQVKSQTLKELESGRVSLPNGWKLTPVGKMLPVGDLPLNMAVSPSGKLIAVTNNGQSDQSIHLIDAEKMQLLDSVIIAKGWLGLTFSKDGKYLFASGGNDNWIMQYQINNKKIVPHDTLVLGKPWPVRISIAGIAVDDKQQLLYTVTKEDNSLYVYDLKAKKIKNKIQLGGEGYTCLLSNDNKTLYVSCWGCDKVVVFDTEKQQVSGFIPVGDNPNDLCISRNGKYLFVSNANDNSVSVISTEKNRVIEILNSALYPNSPAGSTANSLALSDDEKTLYIANADNNCLAVFDVGNPGYSKSKGFIPTGWYPTCVRVIKNTIYVTNGKGLTSKPNPDGPSPVSKDEAIAHHADLQKTKVQYIGGLFTGTLQSIPTPDLNKMALYSQLVYKNTPYSKEKEMVSNGEKGNPIPTRVGDLSPIKYVFYVIKENRTYDQVLGDIPEGNGDPRLVLFGEKVTPNLHKIAKEFVLLDNFYVDGEVSADGHNWTMGAYGTDYLEKNWPSSYGGRGGTYPGEGEKKTADNKDGFLWDYCKRYGISFRTYGEFVSDSFTANIPVLTDHICPNYTGFELSIRDTSRFYMWKRDFETLLAAGKAPRLSTIRFANDHTEGLRVGKPTPKAHNADNDLACGLFVEYLSKSPIWKESVIIMLEDDAQNGPDHVDAHRSTTYVAGGFVKQGYVDHTIYSTSSALRTIELILGLPPMSQYDAAAEPMWRCFNTTANHPPFKSVPNQIDLNLKNKEQNRLSKLSEKFDLSKEDRIPDALFNEVIWAAVHGLNSPCPAPVHAAFFTPEKQGDGDDD
ncbi:MAG: bifunctional YncE family protein/alkaline phosphatase family protein [Prolixibacteraceae bacterium]|jgi:YVTN family beta-propeller protein|nr:bifunctional YncE family protein/alkaline phosphatase family protein [Prolixibacteraceae bacterium]